MRNPDPFLSVNLLSIEVLYIHIVVSFYSHDSKEAIVTQPALASLLLPKGQPLPAGVKLQRPLLAKTLSAIAANGADALYTGVIAENIVTAVSAADRKNCNPGQSGISVPLKGPWKVNHQLHDAAPGNMTLQDLANYQPVVRDVITTKFQEHDIIVAPAVGNYPYCSRWNDPPQLATH